MRRGLPLLLLAVLTAAVPWLACVGDAPQATDDEGKEFGRCFENNTCLTGLVCDKGRCVRGTPDGGPGGGGDAASPIGDASSGVDADKDGPGPPDGSPPACDAGVPPPVPTSVRCDTNTCLRPDQVCCANGSCDSVGNCPAYWECEGPSHCPSARCCMTKLVFTQGLSCPRKTDGVGESRCTQDAVCGAGWFACVTSADCTGGTSCVAISVTLTLDGGSVTLGACM